jgi:hypothetical protein
MGSPKSKVGNILTKATAQDKISWLSDQDQPTLVYDRRYKLIPIPILVIFLSGYGNKTV